ncbi:protein spt2 isoform X2 [Neltuma alba]|uniref:protein spt2 isoform X2 n=1 Tax=Neltuma alba TaxID=207710 RepID=UPI0010A360C5|nr:protein spt2-like isoform X2 [Prosopis alba]
MEEYDRDGYEDYDDYEDEGLEQEYGYEEEGEGEYEEEQPPKPTKEELEYLELRQKLKESIRKQMKKESSTSHAGSSEREKKLPYDNYGSFFGPSQPVIAQRVIQESKSLLENQHLASRLSNPLHISKNKNKVSNGVSKSAVHNQLPKVSQVKLKAQKIKDTRDYSFLLSDDAELPAPAKEPPPRNMSARSSEARPAQVQGKSKQPLSSSGKHVTGGREDRKLGSVCGQLPPKAGSNNKVASTSKPSMASADSRKQLGNNSVNGPGRPVAPKGLPPKMPVGIMSNKSLTPGIKGPVNAVQKPLISKAHSSISKQSVEQRKDTREKPKMMPKQPVASSAPQKLRPPTQVPTHRAVQDQRPKKKPVRRPFEDDDDDEGQRAISMIRRMFHYNPNKFADDDEDDINMEAGFDDIMREERRSAKIAKREDEEQLRLIEEEEERERRRRMAKLKKRGKDVPV